VKPADLATLRAALAGDRAAAVRHAELAAAQREDLDDPLRQTVAAASLHHYYSALESLAERVVRAFEQTLPTGRRWHTELLELAALDVPGVRPALWSAETTRLLRKLLAFRHFFRHAYATAWDPRELAANLEVLDAARPLVERDLDRFVEVLAAAQ